MPVPRLFVSGRTGAGVPALRRQLALEVNQRNGERGAGQPRNPRNSRLIGHNAAETEIPQETNE